MGYHVVDPNEFDPEPNRPSETRNIADLIGLEKLGLQVYDVVPGGEIPMTGLHYHDEQEEVFYVVEGTLSVETPDRVYHVEEGQFFVAEPGSAQRAYNEADADSDVRAIGIGAPPVDDAHAYEG